MFQFVFLYAAMSAGMPAGLASLVLQSSAPFTVLLGALLLRERLTARRLSGVLIALAGLTIVGVNRWQGAPAWPFLLTVLGGLSWAVGNLCSRQARAARPFDLMMWMTVVPPLPMWALAVTVEGPGRVSGALATSLTAEARPAVLGMLYTCLPATVLASGIWTSLLSRHPAGQVGPFSMLVPVVGITSAWGLLGERPAALELVGAAVVIAGVLIASTVGRAPTVTVSGRRRHGLHSRGS